MDDPLRMYLVVRRGAVTELARAGELAGAAAVACLREPAFAEAVAAWRPRPGKVCLRARSDGQWRQALEEPHAPAGDPVAAAPGPAEPKPGALTSLLNPDATMRSGKALAQIAHAAVMPAASGRHEEW